MKNFFPSKQLILGLGLMCLTLYSPLLPDAPNQMQMSPEDLKFLEEAQKEVQQWVDNLPTEASLRARGVAEDQIKNTETKEKFQREVERLSKLSEDELVAEIEDAIKKATDAQAPEAQPGGARELPATVIPAEVHPEPKPATVAPAVTNTKQQAVLALIDSLITSIDNFLRKAQMMVELPSKIVTWTKEGKIRNWPASMPWSTFKVHVEELEAKLHKIKDRDPRTNNYRYIDDLMKDEALINNLTKVKESLAKSEPKIELSSFGIDKMTSESRDSTRTVLASLNEAISALGIPSALDKIIEKYEPTAKKIKESQEAQRQRAVEQSKVPRTQGAVTTTGRPATDNSRYQSQAAYDRDYGRAYSPEHFEAPRQEKLKTDAAKTGAGAGGSAGGAKSDAAKKTADDKDKKSADDKKKTESDKAAEKLFDAFTNAIESFRDILDESDNKLKSIETHMTKDKIDLPKDETIAAINSAGQALRKAKTQAINIKTSSRLTDTQKKLYKRSIKEVYKDAQPEIQKLKTQLSNLLKTDNKAIQMATLTNNETAIYKSKFYTYANKEFQGYRTALQTYVDTEKKRAAAAGTPLQDPAKAIEALLLTPHVTNLNELLTKIDELHKTMSEL